MVQRWETIRDIAIFKFAVFLNVPIFQVLDDENVYDELDFEDFENHFRLKEASASTATMDKLRRMQEKEAQKIRVVDDNRAKNLSKTLSTTQ